MVRTATESRPNAFKVTTSAHEGLVHVSVTGELDLANTPVFRETVADQCESGNIRKLVVDLSRVDFIDSTGLRALWFARGQVQHHNGELHLRNPSRAVRRLLALTKLDHVFAILDE